MLNHLKQFIRQGFVFIFLVAIVYLAHAETGRRECRFPQDPSYPGNVLDPIAWPTVDLDTFASGKLGVIKPTYDHFYLFIAYRKLAGLPITKKDIDHLRHFDPCWQKDSINFYDDESSQKDASRTGFIQWEIERKKTSILIEPDGDIARNTTLPGTVQNYDNCHENAFKVAADTLKSRLIQYGPTPILLDWIQAQDAVFSNCAAPGMLPKDVQAQFPRWLKLDRDYQQAAALLYQGENELAIKKFDLIAITTDSPWHEIAPYLAARAFTRWGTAELQLEKQASSATKKFTEAKSRLASQNASMVPTSRQ